MHRRGLLAYEPARTKHEVLGLLLLAPRNAVGEHVGLNNSPARFGRLWQRWVVRSAVRCPHFEARETRQTRFKHECSALAKASAYYARDLTHADPVSGN